MNSGNREQPVKYLPGGELNVKTRHPNGKLKQEYSRSARGYIHGEYKEWYESGRLRRVSLYEEGNEVNYTVWYEWGVVKKTKNTHCALSFSEANTETSSRYHPNGLLKEIHVVTEGPGYVRWYTKGWNSKGRPIYDEMHEDSEKNWEIFGYETPDYDDEDEGYDKEGGKAYDEYVKKHKSYDDAQDERYYKPDDDIPKKIESPKKTEKKKMTEKRKPEKKTKKRSCKKKVR